MPDAPQAPAAAGSDGEADDAPADEAPAPATDAPPPDAGAPTENGRRGGGTLRVSPIARRMADAAGIDLTALAGRGSGPDGRVVKADSSA